MDVTFPIPDDIAARLGGSAAELSRRVLEGFLAAEYRAGRVDKRDLRRLLGFETGDQIETFLKRHGVYDEYSLEDLEREISGAERLGY